MPNMQRLLLDVGDWDNTRQTVEPLGHFDMLVNNAGFGAIKPFLETSKFDLDSYVTSHSRFIPLLRLCLGPSM